MERKKSTNGYHKIIYNLNQTSTNIKINEYSFRKEEIAMYLTFRKEEIVM